MLGGKPKIKTKKKQKNKESTKIFYKGYMSKKSGIHTEKEFFNILKTHFKDYENGCSKFIKRKKCPSCIKFDKEIQKLLKKKKKNTNHKWSDKEEKKQDKLLLVCRKCKNRNLKKCNLNNHLEYHGASIGNCNNNTTKTSNIKNKSKKIKNKKIKK